MAHTPINHPLRPLYRALSAIVGIYLIVFGVVGFITTPGARGRVLGQGANLPWCVVSLILGVIVLIATLVGRNLDIKVDQYLGWGLVAIGTYELALNRTDANFLHFTVSTVIVTYISALILILSSLYGKVGTDEDARAEQAAAHYGA
jgi:cytochrome bd-type quinol oxidase subunit 2